MITANELKKLSQAITRAESIYRLAVFRNLEEIGEELPVSDGDEETKGLFATAPGCYGTRYEYIVDKVIAGGKQILCHVCKDGDSIANSWHPLECFYDCNEILDGIQWPVGVTGV